MKTHLLRRPVMLILGTAIALTAAACGSSSSPTASSGSATPSTSSAAGASSTATLKVALIEPSLRNDLAFSQSMYAAAASLAGPLHFTLSVSDNLFNVSDAANAMRQYASEGYNLVIAHGSQFGGTVQQLASQFPKTSFAWGTAGVTYGLKNVFAYQANSQEGGYVEGYVAAKLSKSKVLGVIGPINVGDAHLYVVGFKAGALAADPQATVHVSFTGSFSDDTLMATAAKSYVSEKADMLTGSSQSVVGAIGVAKSDKAGWFGTQWDQASLAPTRWSHPRSTTGPASCARSSPRSGAGCSAGPPTRSRWATTARRSPITPPTRCRPRSRPRASMWPPRSSAAPSRHRRTEAQLR